MKILVSLTILCLSITNVLGQTGKASYNLKGKITIRNSYAKTDTNTKWVFDSTFYEIARKQTKFECLKIDYASDTARVEAWIYKPIETKNKKYPLVIFNRGGTGNFGRLEETELINFYKLASSGYVVIASQYRFVGMNGKYDQLGGVEINDILNLSNVYNTLPYIDTCNIFMYGVSRGGQMTYQISKIMKLNAIAVIGGVADFEIQTNNRNEFIEGWIDDKSPDENFIGLKNILTNFETNKKLYLYQRSATQWTDSIKSPILILHSRQDRFVSCDQVVKLASELQKYKKEYSLTIYDKKSHALPIKYFDSYDRIVEWFNLHKKNCR
jgi:dipeptidyl aminopeptidase/acylaminoacyl peptidase